ncbi:hypothetical protein LTR22_024227 [Elasticomyces elasticus]|nr:hypothetical protein LTR22_024227 [Elasticomyces elasticus]
MNLTAAVLNQGWAAAITWYWQIFDIRSVWYGSAFNFLGGGDAVISALLLVVVADIAPEAARADAFLRIGALSGLASLFMPPLAAWSMSIDPWVSVLVGIGLSALAVGCYLLVPETLGYRESHASTLKPPARMPVSADLVLGEPHLLASTVKRWVESVKCATSFVTSDWRVPALMASFIGQILIASSAPLLVQYVSKRYAVTLAEATLLMTIRNAVNAIQLFFILPYISTVIVETYSLSGQLKDLYLMRASQVLVAIGWISIGASPSVPSVAISLAIISFGNGSLLLARSFLTSLVPAHQIASIFSIICVVDTVGTMLGAPILAQLFKRGLALKGGWIGLPFYFIGTFSALFAVVFFYVRLQEDQQQHQVLNEEEVAADQPE